MIPKSIVVHHSASAPSTTLNQIDEWHRDRGFTRSSLGYYIGYHFVIEQSGNVFQARNTEEIGCHCVPNTGKVGVCLIGDFSKGKPTDAQLNALMAVLDTLTEELKLSPSDIYGHRELKATECPGDNLFNWVKLYRQLGFLKDQIRILLARIAAKKEVYKG
jgi:N-acetylmuramoyl-L-alanine amidase